MRDATASPEQTRSHAPAVTTIFCEDRTPLSLCRYGDDDARAAVILLHGFIQNAAAWSVPSRSLVHTLVDAGYAVYPFNLRGRDGGVVRHDLLTAVDEDAAAVVHAVADRHERVAFVGHSMGGLIGASLPPRAAQKLAAVAVLGSPLFPGRPILHRRPVTTSLWTFGRGMGFSGRAFDGPRYARAFVAGRKLLDGAMSRALPLPLWRPGSFADDNDLRHTLENAFAFDSHHVLADLIDMVRTSGVSAGRLPIARRLQEMTAPLLAIAGDVDALAPPDSVRALVQRTASRDKRFLEVSAGHIDLVVGDSAPSLVWGPLTSFLGRHMQ
jgi:pimeloyl-ACP methyl ester carboxylesterase